MEMKEGVKGSSLSTTPLLPLSFKVSQMASGTRRREEKATAGAGGRKSSISDVDPPLSRFSY